jgi:hypothetical protein
MRAKICLISLESGRRACGLSRFEYHACAICQSCGNVTVGRRG